MAKVGQQVLMSPRQKLDILALSVLEEGSQAEVARRALDIGLPQIQRAYESELKRLMDALESMTDDVPAALADMAEVKLRSDGKRRRLTYADLKTTDGKLRVRYPFGASNAAVKA